MKTDPKAIYRTHTLLFAAGLVLVSATKLRLAASVGIGEAILLTLAIWVLYKKIVQKKLLIDRKSYAFGVFVLVSAVALTMGTVTSMLLGVWQRSLFLHDGLALGFTFVCVFLNWSQVQDQGQTPFFSATLVCLFGCFSLVYVLLYLLSFQTDALDELVYDEFRWRFVGLSQNPNQIALYLCCLPFLTLYQKYPLLKPSVAVLLKSALLLCIWQLGRLTQSDALYLAWQTGAVAGGLCWYYHSESATFKWPLKSALIATTILASYGTWAAYLQEKYDHDQQGWERLTRWQFGLKAWGQSVLWGFGPGSFSGTHGAFEGEEAHNSFIDWADATGALGLGSLCFFVFMVLQKCWRQPILWAAAVALLVFSWFHYALRQPIFWVYLLLFWSVRHPVRKL